MIRTLLAVVTASVSLIACASGATESPDLLTDVERARLAELGIHDAVPEASTVQLYCADGEDVGEVSFYSKTVTATFGGNVATSRVIDGGLELSCNGSSISLAGRTGTLPSGSTDALDACTDAFDVAAMMTSDVDPPKDGVSSVIACGDHETRMEGCVSWNAASGCTLKMVCYVIDCPGFEAQFNCIEFDASGNQVGFYNQ